MMVKVLQERSGRFVRIIVALALAFAMVPCMAQPAQAAGNSLASATSYTLGSSVSGSITDSNTEDFYRFTLSSAGRITLAANAYMYSIRYSIYDASGSQLWNSSQYWDSTVGLSSTSETIDLTAGTYYFAASRSSGTGSYKFKLTFASAGESFAESQGGSNNTLNEAQAISLGTSYAGQIAINDDVDFYRFTLSSAGRVTLTANAYMSYIHYIIYDASGSQLWDSYQHWDSTAVLSSTSETIDLTAGAYYFVASRYSGTGSYNFKLSFTSAGESFVEPQGGSNNTLTAAQTISLGTSYTGQIAINDNVDFYRFTLSSAGRITLAANAYMYSIRYSIYDASGSQLWNSSQYWDSTAGRSSTSETIDLSKGTYYFAASQSYYTGKYTFRLSNTLTSLSLSKTSYTYNGKSHKPSVTVKSASGTVKSSNYKVTIVNAKGTTVSSPKAIGKYKVKVAGKGSYSGISLSATFTINPPGTSISKVQGKSDKFSVKWKKKSATTATGYQIRYSTNKSFRYATTKTIKGAKKWQKTISYPTWSGAKLWVQVRTYKTVNGTKFYSKWSTKKSVKVKP